MHCFAVYTIECAATIPKLRFILILIVFQTRREGSRASPPETSGSEWSAFAVALETSNVYSVNKRDVLSRDVFIFYGPFKFIRMTRDIYLWVEKMYHTGQRIAAFGHLWRPWNSCIPVHRQRFYGQNERLDLSFCFYMRHRYIF